MFYAPLPLSTVFLLTSHSIAQQTHKLKNAILARFISPEVEKILQQIQELGLVSFSGGSMKFAIAPSFNIYYYGSNTGADDRWNATIRYLQEYAHFHPSWNGTFFLCLYDGWRENSKPSDPLERIYIDWTFMQENVQKKYLTYGSIGEPRFSVINPSF